MYEYNLMTWMLVEMIGICDGYQFFAYLLVCIKITKLNRLFGKEWDEDGMTEGGKV